MYNRNNSTADYPEIPHSPRRFFAVVGDGEADPRSAPVDRGSLPTLGALSEMAIAMASDVRAGSVPFVEAVNICYAAATKSHLPETAVQFVLAQAFGTVQGRLSSAMSEVVA